MTPIRTVLCAIVAPFLVLALVLCALLILAAEWLAGSGAD